MSDFKNLKKKFHEFVPNPMHQLPVGDDVPAEINMLVEIPKGSINKFEYNTDTGLFKLDRVLFEQLPYPVEYGAIPQTWDEDDDLLDIMSMISYPTFPGCVISVRPIGVMIMNDTGEVDDKIMAVPVDDVRFREVQDLSDLSDHAKDEIQFFWENYKTLQFKYKKQTDAKIVIEGWKDKSESYKIIEACMNRYKKKFVNNGAE